MSDKSAIEWTDATWNPIRGCSLVSDGCRSCYAMKQAHRFSGKGQAYEGLTRLGPNGPTWTGKIALIEDALDEPLHWKKPRRVFVNSMSDLFHEGVPAEFIERVFSVMALAERHTFQVLTKRADRMRAWFTARRFDVKGFAVLQTESGDGHYAFPWPLPNVWLGVSVENQHFADERIPLLLQTPAAVRFISAEPLLGPVDLRKVSDSQHGPDWHPLIGWKTRYQHKAQSPDECSLGVESSSCDARGVQHPKLDWVIVGGESGPDARLFDLALARSIVQQCKAAGVPVFVKQLGTAFAIQQPTWSTARRHDRKGGDPSEWPADLRIREFPAAMRVCAHSRIEVP